MTIATPLPCLEIGPARARGAVVWMHGLGAGAHDFEPIVPMLGRPDLRFVFPQAPDRPVTINGGYVMPAWYDIRSLDPGAHRENEAHIRASAAAIDTLLDRELSRGVDPTALVVAGFSQGAAMALHVGMRRKVAMAGIAVLSGYRVLSETWPDELSAAAAATSILLCHGTADPVVDLTRGEEARDALFDRVPADALRWHTFDMGHEVIPAEVGVIADWLDQVVPRVPAANH